MADGSERIGQTALTWSILESDLQKQLKTTAKFGANRSAELLTDGNGFFCFVFAVNFDWIPSSTSLPSKAALKIMNIAKIGSLSSSSGKISNLLECCTAMANNELLFYENVRFKFALPPEIKLPQFFAGRRFGTDDVPIGYILLELYENTVPRHFTDVITTENVLEFLAQSAILGAYSLQHPELFADIPFEGYDTVFRDMCQGQKIENSICKTIERFSNLAANFELLKPTARRYFQEFEAFAQFVNGRCRVKMFHHNDAWPGNVLWCRRPNSPAESLELAAVVDWQFARLGSGLEDLVRFFTLALMPDEFEAKRDFLLRFYFTELKRRAATAELPWDSYEEFVENFEKMWAITAAWCTSSLCTFFEVQLRGAKGDATKIIEIFEAKLNYYNSEAARYTTKWNL